MAGRGEETYFFVQGLGCFAHVRKGGRRRLSFMNFA